MASRSTRPRCLARLRKAAIQACDWFQSVTSLAEQANLPMSKPAPNRDYNDCDQANTWIKETDMKITASNLLRWAGLSAMVEVQAGRRVLINGASGGMGLFAVQITKSLGTTVTGVCSTTKMEMVHAIGADHVIDCTKEDFTRSAHRYLILDMVGNHSLSQLRRALRPHGTPVLVGGEGGDRWIGALRPPALIRPAGSTSTICRVSKRTRGTRGNLLTTLPSWPT